MGDGCGDERAVCGHLEGLARHLCAREDVYEERRVLGDARRGRARKVRREDLLEELQQGCCRQEIEDPRQRGREAGIV